MKIIEVRDGFIKFEADENVYLSSFVQVKGMDKNYIAQVSQLKTFGNVHIASAKILFILRDGVLYNYDKTEPSKDAEINTFSSELLLNSIKAEKPIITGKTQDNEANVVIDSSAFNKNLLISADNEELKNLFIRNLLKQFENIGINTLVLDTTGLVKAKKFVAGTDFKLPLDTETLMFMYKSCLDDATSESKSTIVEIFQELSEYSKTVPFVPFGTLKSIVDDMVDKQHVFKLLVLKNKLTKYERQGYFATKQSEADSIEKILASKCAIIDLSKLDSLFLNCYLEFLYSKLNGRRTQVFLDLSNVISKKNLKNIISDSEVPTTLLVHSKYQYLNDIKSMFSNFIIEPSAANNELFKEYAQFFGSMQKDMYMIAGECVNYIPIVSKAQIIDDVIAVEAAEEDKETTVEQEIDGADNIIAEEVVESYEEAKAIEQGPSQDEIIANIEEKSENIINSVSEDIEDVQEIDLFTEDDDDINDTEGDIVISDSEEETTPQEEINDVIEPEYTDITDSSDNLVQEDVIDEQEDFSDTQEELSDFKDETFEEQEFEELNEEELSEAAEPIQDYEGVEEIGESNSSEELIEELNDVEEPEYQAVEEEIDELSEDAETDLLESELDLSDDSEEELSIQVDDMADMLQDQEDEFGIDESAEGSFEENDLSDLSEPQVIAPEEYEDDMQALDEIVELDASEASEDDIVIDMTDEGADNINIDEDTDQQIVEDVDKVYTTIKDTDELEEISDSDLDLIDELNSDGDELEEYAGNIDEASDSIVEDGILDQPQESIIPERQPKEKDAEILEKREANTPIVPVYDADIPQEDMVVSDPIQQGDSVVHAKYGSGVVEKMIKYGTKTLFSINFENIGRRLLDPTLTEIKKL